LTTEHGALLAIDEVITCRLAPGGRHRDYGIAPDLVSLGKIIGGGFPVGAVGGRADVLEAFSPLGDGPVSWGGTFSANPVTMTAGLTAMLDYDDAAVTELNTKGDRLRRRLLDAGLLVNGRGSLLRLMSVDMATLAARRHRLTEAAGVRSRRFSVRRSSRCRRCRGCRRLRRQAPMRR
jgi:glutamate-1-semialdehyde 2,1-aminomutase